MSLEDIIDSGAVVLMEYPNTSLEDGKARIEGLMKDVKEMIEIGVLPKDTFVPEIVILNGYTGIVGGNITHGIY